ncbi:substrate-binding periplasmic protein [Vibrio sinaloensis]|uniref:substrate-binding periplasmic protein n=1 Tax=Photobacterium sp. (strain ATCC 43367) TaxID=379097 RepID=UPI0009077E54|nr:transporter substrate-binding domain-containing protein [Vibrio sinaloensis]
MRSLLVVLVMCMSAFNAYASSPKTIRLAYSDVESFPFQMGNGNAVATPPGLSVDIIEQAADTLGVEIKYVRIPGKRVLQQIKTNQVDGGFIFSYSPERARYAAYPTKDNQADSALRIATLDYFFYRLRDQSLEWDGINLSANITSPIGVHNGFSIQKVLSDKGIETLEMPSTAQLFELLKKRRVSAVAIQSNIADSYIEKNQLPNIVKVNPPILRKYYYLIFSQRFAAEDPELVSQMWSTIGNVRDEVIANHMNKYLLR